MKVVDARDDHKVPVTVELPEGELFHTEEWLDDGWALFCVERDGRYTACAQRVNRKGGREIPMMCVEYKTMRGFMNWVKRFHPHAVRKALG